MVDDITIDASTITAKVKVHLKTRESVEGESKWAHPITELRCLVDATSAGGIVLTGNTLSFDRSVLGLVTSAEIPVIGYTYFCPLVTSTVVLGTTTMQYANMHVLGATATVTELPNSTGYGEFGFPINVQYTVRDPDDASHTDVPSEYAVAAALAQKQRILSAGAFVSITPGNVADIITVSSAAVVRESGVAESTVFPTEAAVRDAIMDASTACNNYASTITSNTSAALSAADVETSNWVNLNFALKSEIPDPGSAYTFTGGIVENPAGTVSLAAAGNASKGGVYVPTGSGLTLDTTDGKLKLTIASAAVLGGVMVPAGSGLSLNSATGSLTLAAASNYTSYGATDGVIGGVRVVKKIESSNDVAYINSGYVPSVQAVYDYVSGQTFTLSPASTAETYAATTPELGGIRVVSDGGLVITDGSTAGNLYLDSATDEKLGGVAIKKYEGLLVDGGTVSVDDSYKNAFQIKLQPRREPVESPVAVPAAAAYTTINNVVTDVDGKIVYYSPEAVEITLAGSTVAQVTGVTSFVEGTTLGRHYVAVTSKSTFIDGINGDIADVVAGRRWLLNNNQEVYTINDDPELNEHIYADTDATTIIGFITDTTGASGRHYGATIYGCTAYFEEPPASFAELDAPPYTVPVAELYIDAEQSVTVRQLQHGPIVSGSQVYLGASTASIYLDHIDAAEADSGYGLVKLVKSLNDVTSETDVYAFAPTLYAVKNYVDTHGGGGGGGGADGIQVEVDGHTTAEISIMDGATALSAIDLIAGNGISFASYDDGANPGVTISVSGGGGSGRADGIQVVVTGQTAKISIMDGETALSAIDLIAGDGVSLKSPAGGSTTSVIISAGYSGDFKLYRDGSAWKVGQGTIYLDGPTVCSCIKGATTYSGTTTNDTVVWAQITVSGVSGNTLTATVTYAASPAFSTTTTSYPIAKIIDATTCIQYQHGPIVLRGRWT